MRIAAGFKAHSGWAALVVIGESDDGLVIVDRRRIELVDPADIDWAKQPYHAAESLPADKARELIERATSSANRIALKEMRAFIKRSRDAGHEIAGCAVLVGTPMPEWTIEQIRSVHVRMHKAEGVLFPAALARAVEGCDLNLVTIPEKERSTRANASLDLDATMKEIATLGKSVGPPWGKDQKTAALAAMLVLGVHQTRS
jgi:hypothetical protein